MQDAESLHEIVIKREYIMTYGHLILFFLRKFIVS